MFLQNFGAIYKNNQFDHLKLLNILIIIKLKLENLYDKNKILQFNVVKTWNFKILEKSKQNYWERLISNYKF